MKKYLFTGLFISLILLISCGQPGISFEKLTYKAAGEEFVNMLVEKNYSEAVKHFDPVMRMALPKNKLEKTWEEQLQVLGEFQKIEESTKTTYKQYIIVVVKTSFKNSEGKTAYLDIKVTFNESKQVVGLFFIPASGPADFDKIEYVDKTAFTEEEVSFGKPEYKLPGTLSVPNENKFNVAVILVHGSGPNDRDETLGPNKPFKDIAWGLASNGITVLRYEKRTKEHAEKVKDQLHELTVYGETIEDAVLAAKFMKEDKGYENIIIIGHSLGAMMIPRIASKTDIPAGYVMLAGTARKFEDVFWEQVSYIFRLDGELTDKEKQELNQTRDLIKQVKEIQAKKITKDPQIILGASNKYWIDLDEYDFCEYFNKMEKPALILQGERDYQITMKDFQSIKDCLNKPKDKFEFKSYPALNHLFMPGKGKSHPQEYMKPSHVSKDVVMDIVSWIETTLK